MDRVEIVVVGLYAPANRREKPQFLADLARIPLHDKQLWLGDLNAVANPALDSSNPGRHADWNYGPLMAQHHLVDLFRHKQPTSRRFTHQSAAWASWSRLDYVLVSDTLVD